MDQMEMLDQSGKSEVEVVGTVRTTAASAAE